MGKKLENGPLSYKTYLDPSLKYLSSMSIPNTNLITIIFHKLQNLSVDNIFVFYIIIKVINDILLSTWNLR